MLDHLQNEIHIVFILNYFYIFVIFLSGQYIDMFQSCEC